ncbi:pseudouridine synthase [Micrococcus lylae]|uniref:pseudouridine synthase n=1 Tax=Micrococcus lylae TaxID=1273 RepID=UPI000C803A91|nr:pseudouridine synthase [Micrococcus lylae]WIK82097.1 pseudouridine synthase [Micrococcus lylae]
MPLPSPLPVRQGVNATRLRLPMTGPEAAGTVQEHLVSRFGHVDPDGIRGRFARGEVVAADGTALTAATPLGVHEFIWYYRDLPQEEPLPARHRLLHRDEHLVVIDKPHFLPTTPGGRFIQETALVRLRNELGLDDLVPLHRLDRATAGVVMFSANPATRGAYHLLFERRRARKVYEAVSALPPGTLDRLPDGGPLPSASTLASGATAPRQDGVGAPVLDRFPLTVRSRIRKDKGILRSVVEDVPVSASGRAAGAEVRTKKSNLSHAGANAETHVELLATGRSAGTLAGAEVAHFRLHPRTGRTHQLRIHLAALGLGIAFDPFYPDLLDAAPDDVARPLQLLARELRFTDPVTGRDRVFTSEFELQERPA